MINYSACITHYSSRHVMAEPTASSVGSLGMLDAPESCTPPPDLCSLGPRCAPIHEGGTHCKNIRD